MRPDTTEDRLETPDIVVQVAGGSCCEEGDMIFFPRLVGIMYTKQANIRPTAMNIEDS
jgi:hypothetical protein